MAKLLLILSLALLFAACIEAYNYYNANCYYDDDIVYENSASRLMTADERMKMLEYGIGWRRYGIQLGGYFRGFDSMPTEPELPCFCANCTKN